MFTFNKLPSTANQINEVLKHCRSTVCNTVVVTTTQSDSPLIMIVDDTAFNIEIMQMMIENNFGLKCDCATSGLQSMEKLKKHIQRGKPMYKLIIMDINMPGGIDGCETVKRMRRMYPNEMGNALVVAYTAIPRESLGRLQDTKFDAYLSKPNSI